MVLGKEANNLNVNVNALPNSLYEFTGIIARELVGRFIVKALFIEGCMMIIALSVNGPRGSCGEAVNLLTRQLGSLVPVQPAPKLDKTSAEAKPPFYIVMTLQDLIYFCT